MKQTTKAVEANPQAKAEWSKGQRQFTSKIGQIADNESEINHIVCISIECHISYIHNNLSCTVKSSHTFTRCLGSLLASLLSFALIPFQSDPVSGQNGGYSREEERQTAGPGDIRSLGHHRWLRRSLLPQTCPTHRRLAHPHCRPIARHELETMGERCRMEESDWVQV